MNMSHAVDSFRIVAQREARPPSVFIVDDDVSVREAIESFLCQEGFDIKSFESATSLLAYPYQPEPGCLLLDISMPELTGLEVQKSLAVDRPTMPIIFITGRDDARTVVEAMKAGAVEFLTKPFSDDTLLAAILVAIERSKVLVREERLRMEIKGNYAELSRREREVFSLTIKGFLNREIGEKMGISEITVKAHRGKVMKKMKADSFADLIHMAVQAGI
ncbi:FixJ family two-component response regulator [Paraburkholderia sp. GAS199]|uniref:response regulator transcription factor n=1 Tax=Paraburkholderia sp. GAS199 TaxID=3035126 RepID=UPI003D21F805